MYEKTALRMTYIFFDTSKLDDSFVNRALGDESIHSDLASLSQSMRTIHGLGIVRWVPVVIIEDDGVGCGQIDTETASTGAQQENENIRPATIEVISVNNTQAHIHAVLHTLSATP